MKFHGAQVKQFMDKFKDKERNDKMIARIDAEREERKSKDMNRLQARDQLQTIKAAFQSRERNPDRIISPDEIAVQHTKNIVFVF